MVLSIFNMSSIINVQASEEENYTQEIDVIKNNSREILKEEKNKDVAVGIIVSLISGEHTFIQKAKSINKNDKIDTMYQIINILRQNTCNYKEGISLKEYLKKYAPYAGEEYLIKYIENNLIEDSITTYAAYNRDAAVSYAKNWAYSYNYQYYPNLDAMGGDCTNFVSQCLYAGGMSMSDPWYIYRKNGTYVYPGNWSQLTYSWSVADPSAWISAPRFNYYWQYKSYDQEFNASYVYENQSSIYSQPYTRGDVIQIMEKEAWWYTPIHTMIIVECNGSNQDYYLAAHSNNCSRQSLHYLAKAFAYPSGQYKIKFFGL